MTKVGSRLLDRPTYAVIAARRARRRPRGAPRHPLAAAAGAHRGRRGAHRPRAARRAARRWCSPGTRRRPTRSPGPGSGSCARPPPTSDLVASGPLRRRGANGRAVEAVIIEGMRARPVIPITGRRVMVPWRLGDYAVAAEHAGADQHPAAAPPRGPLPRPLRLPPRALARHKPGTYEWIPFGGGIRRCLGAALAMAEQRVVLAR